MTKICTRHPNFIVSKLSNVLDDQASVRLRLNELVALLCHLALHYLPVKSLLVELLIKLKGGDRLREGSTGDDGDVVILITSYVQYGVACIG